jgi:hypothetical protein
MPYQDHAEYPRGVFHTAVLTNVAQDVGTSGQAVKVSHYLIRSGGGGNDVIIFRNSAGTSEYFRIDVPAQTSICDPRGFTADEGLEVLTLAAAGDVYLSVFYAVP